MQVLLSLSEMKVKLALAFFSSSKQRHVTRAKAPKHVMQNVEINEKIVISEESFV